MTADNVLFEIKGLKKNFGDLEVLKGLHTTIRKGEVVVVIGPSGSGKSTFIRCLNLLETPTEGQIFFEGSCITDKGYAVHKHREKVGMVFQQFNLFNNLTILENVTISLKKVKKVPAPAAEEKPEHCCGASVWRTRRMPIPLSCPADRSSGSPLSGLWRWSRT